MINDTISDMLTRIRNANMVKHEVVKIPFTKMALAIAKILKEERFIKNFENYIENGKNYLLISLRYMGKSRKPVISKIERISKPGLRVYSSSKTLPRVLDDLGIAIISTSKGVISKLKNLELEVKFYAIFGN